MPQLNKDARYPVSLTLNGRKVMGTAEPRMLLSDFLTHEIGITSCHVGCEHGVCGACTVLIDGVVARGCLTRAVQADGATIETSESLAAEDGELSDLQKAFKKHHGLQCGYCTPGILMSLTAYLKENPKPTEEELRDMLSGHLCRCTGYVGMVRAVLDYCENQGS
ncbi:MAG: (2Fe-2S)-binding protein [Alphaproteobacteria bacterium]